MTSLRTAAEGLRTHDAPRVRTAAVVVVPFVIAVLVGISRSVQVPLWRDEQATAMHAALEPADLLRALSGGDAVQGPYYLLIHLLAPVIGLEEGMRIPSLAAFAITASLISVIGLRWWGALPGAAAGVFFSLNGAAITAGTTARPYALMLMFIAIAVLAADMAERRGRWMWPAYAAAALLAVAMHLISIVAIAAIGLLALARPRGFLRRWIAWSAPALVVGLALAAIGTGQAEQIAWLPSPDIRSGISALAQAAGGSLYRAVVFDACALLALGAAAGAALWTIGSSGPAGTRSARLRPALFAAALTIVAPLSLFVLSWITTPVFTARYLTWVSLGSALLVGAAVAAAMIRRRTVSLIAGICATLLIAGAAWVSLQHLSRPPGLYDDVPSLIDAVERGAEMDDALVVIQRNPHSGLAYSMARGAADRAWAADVRAALPSSAQPLVDVRRVSESDPLALASMSAVRTPAPPVTVWIVSLDVPSTSELAGIEDALGCTPDVSDAEPTFFGGIRLYEAPCG